MRHVICRSCLLETRWGMFANPDDLRAKIVEEHFPKSAELSNTIFNIFILWRRGGHASLSQVRFRTCAAAWAVRGDKWRSWQYKKVATLEKLLCFSGMTMTACTRTFEVNAGICVYCCHPPWRGRAADSSTERSVAARGPLARELYRARHFHED